MWFLIFQWLCVPFIADMNTMPTQLKESRSIGPTLHCNKFCSVLRDTMLSCPLEISRRFGTCSFHLHGRRLGLARNQYEAYDKHSLSISSLAYIPTLSMETTCSSETLPDFRQTTGHYIPKDKTVHNHRCVNFKSYTNSVIESANISITCIQHRGMQCIYYYILLIIPFPQK